MNGKKNIRMKSKKCVKKPTNVLNVAHLCHNLAIKMTLRRGFEIKKEDKVLVVEDVITTGLSTGEVLEAVKSTGAKIIGVGCIVDRSGKVLDFEVKLKSLIKLNFPTYKPEECPLCKKGVEITKPGSR